MHRLGRYAKSTWVDTSPVPWSSVRSVRLSSEPIEAFPPFALTQLPRQLLHYFVLAMSFPSITPATLQQASSYDPGARIQEENHFRESRSSLPTACLAQNDALTGRSHPSPESLTATRRYHAHTLHGRKKWQILSLLWRFTVPRNEEAVIFTWRWKHYHYAQGFGTLGIPIVNRTD